MAVDLITYKKILHNYTTLVLHQEKIDKLGI